MNEDETHENRFESANAPQVNENDNENEGEGDVEEENDVSVNRGVVVDDGV